MPSKPKRMKKRITEIEIECRETYVISVPRAAARPVCGKCGAAAMILPEEAAALACLTLRGVFRLIEANKVHFEETATGVVYICAASLELGGSNSRSNIFWERL
jgi:hypothetical protein